LFSARYQRFVLLNSGKGPSLYRHELLSLHNRQNHRFSHTVDKIPVKLVPRLVYIFLSKTLVHNLILCKIFNLQWCWISENSCLFECV